MPSLFIPVAAMGKYKQISTPYLDEALTLIQFWNHFPLHFGVEIYESACKEHTWLYVIVKFYIYGMNQPFEEWLQMHLHDKQIT